MEQKSGQNQDSNNSRRRFIQNGAALAGLYILPRHVLGGVGYRAPSDMLTVAGIGAGGKGESDLNNFFKSGKANIAVLCDVDDRQSAKSRERFPRQNITRTSAKCSTRKVRT